MLPCRISLPGHGCDLQLIRQCHLLPCHGSLQGQVCDLQIITLLPGMHMLSRFHYNVVVWLQPADQRASVAENTITGREYDHCDENTITEIIGCIVVGLFIVGVVYFLVTNGFLSSALADMVVYAIVGHPFDGGRSFSNPRG